MSGPLTLLIGAGPGVVFAPVAGSYSQSGPDPDISEFTISCNLSAVWTWSKTAGTHAGADIVSGSTATSITFDVTSIPGFNFGDPTGANSATFTLSVTAAGVTANFTVTLSVTGA